MQRERSLVTVLFTDIVGSTERAAELRDSGWRDLRQEHDRRVRRELRRFGGREINTAGDSFLATFDRPARAIACAGAIRAAVRELGLEVRAGLHMGELEGARRDLGGLALNIGARVAAEAGPGEILVSRSVHDALTGSAFDFEDRGLRALKGVPSEWRLFAVTSIPAEASEALPSRLRRTLARRRVLVGSAAAVVLLLGLAGFHVARRNGPALTPEEVLAAGAAPAIAVLPFTVNDPTLETWREGMVDLLSINLDGVPGLRAIDSRTVLARWREDVTGTTTPDLATALGIAQRTGARYALVGNVVAAGPSVRLLAEVYDARSAVSLGRTQVDGPPDSIPALVDQLSMQLLGTVLQIEDKELPRFNLAGVTTSSLEALKAYLDGEGLFRRADFAGAFASYTRAIEADSNFALASLRILDACGWGGGDVNPNWWPAADSAGRNPEICMQIQERYPEVVARLVGSLPAREAILLRARDALERGSLDGLEPLRQLVRTHPDDAEAWSLLGEIYEVLAYQALLDPSESRKAFSRAVALDPGFAPYLIYAVGHAIGHADSARAASLLESYGRLTSRRNEFYRRWQLAFVLAFGDSAGRTQALAALDTVPLEVLKGIYVLGHPRFLPIQEQAIRIRRAQPDALPPVAWGLFRNLRLRGKFRAALAQLDDPLISPEYRSMAVYRLYWLGMRLTTEQLDRALALSKADTTIGLRNFYSGAYAADQGQWRDLAIAIERERAQARRVEAAGDSVAARGYRGAAQALEAYGAWKRGPRGDTASLLEEARRQTFQLEYINETILWWLGQLFMELDRPRDAERYFRPLGEDPFFAYELGRIHADLGESEKARESYEYALLAWREADPELHPRIEAARRALSRLPKPLRREGP